jgi:EamA-like transporter family.
MSFWNWSIEYTSVANATLMANTAPIFVSFIGLIFLRHKVSPDFFFLLLLAVLGVSLVFLSSSPPRDFHVFGDFLGVSAAIFYAGCILAIASLTGRFSPAPTLFLATLVTSLILVPISLFGTRDLVPPTTLEWGVLFTYALISPTIAPGFITYGISQITAPFSSLILLIQPLAAAFYGWLLLNEAFLPIPAFGGLIVLTSIYLATRKT